MEFGVEALDLVCRDLRLLVFLVVGFAAEFVRIFLGSVGGNRLDWESYGEGDINQLLCF